MLEKFLESFLLEDVALTKGSQRVMSNKNLVAGLADAMRDDAQAHPGAFPAGSSKSFQKADDAVLAQWFLENIDRIEKEGYEGTVYSRDGVNSDWIARRYIAGSHNWEDLTGVMNMNLRDWYLLKNRDMLDPKHTDLAKFGSVRDVGRYMTTHYADKLTQVRDAAKNAARNKMSKSVKLVDNDDYRIYTTLNRAAGCALGLGTQWCTANSNYDGHYHRYSNEAMLFQLFPYDKDAEGNKIPNATDKFQFDAGGPTFMDVTDTPVNANKVKERFPYIYTDLAKGLVANKAKMEKDFATLSIDPTMQGADFKIKQYEIDDEIKKLHKFVDRGYFTDAERQKAIPQDHHEQPAGEVHQPAEQPAQPPQEDNIMENKVDTGVAEWMNRFKAYDDLKASKAPVMEKKKEEKEKVDEEGNPWEKLGKEEKEEKSSDSHKTEKGGTVTKTEKGLTHKAGDKKAEKVEEGVDPEVLEWMSRFAKLGNMKGYGR